MQRFVTGALILFCAAAALAQEPQKKHDDAHAAMIKAGTPGAPHQSLDAFVGTWDTKVTMWPAPGAEPIVTTGVSVNRPILGGRFIEQRFTANFMGTPFEGLGYTGYDNVGKKFVGIWMDNMSTAPMISHGTASDAKTWAFTASYPDPMTGKETRVDEKVIVTDADHHTMEMWNAGPDGKMYKSMEIAYARKK